MAINSTERPSAGLPGPVAAMLAGGIMIMGAPAFLHPYFKEQDLARAKENLLLSPDVQDRIAKTNEAMLKTAWEIGGNCKRLAESPNGHLVINTNVDASGEIVSRTLATSTIAASMGGESCVETITNGGEDFDITYIPQQNAPAQKLVLAHSELIDSRQLKVNSPTISAEINLSGETCSMSHITEEHAPTPSFVATCREEIDRILTGQKKVYREELIHGKITWLDFSVVER